MLCILILLEVLLRHLPLDDHEARVDEGLLEQLALEHPHKIFNPDVLTGRPFDDSAVGLNLLLLCQCLLRIGLSLLLQGGLVLLEELLGFLERVLRVLAIDALVVEFCGGGLDLREHLEHVVGVELAGPDQSQEEASVWRESPI